MRTEEEIRAKKDALVEAIELLLEREPLTVKETAILDTNGVGMVWLEWVLGEHDKFDQYKELKK